MPQLIMHRQEGYYATVRAIRDEDVREGRGGGGGKGGTTVSRRSCRSMREINRHESSDNSLVFRAEWHVSPCRYGSCTRNGIIASRASLWRPYT